jgi:hypothetical protein
MIQGGRGKGEEIIYILGYQTVAEQREKRENIPKEGFVNQNEKRLKKLSMHRKVFSFSLH